MSSVKIRWEELNDIIHQCKNTLQLTHSIELDVSMKCKKMRLTILEQLEKMNEIILSQAEGNKK